MSFDAPDFVTVLCLEIMDSNIAIPVTTRNLFAIMTYSYTSDCLLNIQRFSDHDFVNIAVSRILYLLSFFIAIYGLCFEHFKVRWDIVKWIIYEYYFAHVFAISIAEQSFLDLGSIGCWNWRIVNEVPKSYCPVACTSHESCKSIFLLQVLAFICFCKANGKAFIQFLYVMNRTIMRQKCSDYLNFCCIFNIP